MAKTAPVVTRHTPFEELPEWMTPEELQTYLAVSKNTAYGLLAQGAIPSQRWGRLYRIHRSAVGWRRTV